MGSITFSLSSCIDPVFTMTARILNKWKIFVLSGIVMIACVLLLIFITPPHPNESPDSPKQNLQLTPPLQTTQQNPATSPTERPHYDYCMIDEVHPDYLHVIPDFISPNATIVHLNAADMKSFPEYEEKMTNETRLSQKWRDGHRSVAVFKDYQRQYSYFQNLTCKISSDPACNPRQEALFEYNERYFRVGCYPDFGREHPTPVTSS